MHHQADLIVYPPALELASVVEKEPREGVVLYHLTVMHTVLKTCVCVPATAQQPVWSISSVEYLKWTVNQLKSMPRIN